MTDNFENLGFQVKIDGADSAVSHLDNIVKKLERIQALNGGKQLKTTNTQSVSEDEKYIKRVENAKKLLNSEIYIETRRIELANKQRKKEIDQRLEQELGIKKTTNSLSKLVKKLTSVVYIAKRLGSFFVSAIDEGSKYVENLNLFSIAFGETYKETHKWAIDIAQGFGLANNEIVKFAGTFRQLSTSLGLVGGTADNVSKYVTQLGYDFSALFNTSVEDAMEAFESSIFTGQTKPLRRYGIDISQKQIDALFETNEALAQLGVNARNLTQSDKVLARMIITMRDGSNAFGTMNREINTLQSQIRILQGSFSNFKLAVGDFIYEPARQAIVALNGLLIAMTNIIRAFVPLKDTDDNNVFNGVALGAEEANEQIDELNGKLAEFDKFNVLGGQTSGNATNSAITDALTKELEKQQQLYDKQVEAMEEINNEAVELAKNITSFFVVLDEKGKFVEWTNNAKLLFGALTVGLGAIFAIIIKNKVHMKSYTQALVQHTVALEANTIALQKNSNAMGASQATMATTSKALYATKSNILSVEKALVGLSLAFAVGGLVAVWSSEESSGSKLIKTFVGLAAAIGAAAISLFLFEKNWTRALSVAGVVAGGYFSILSQAGEVSGFANGGYTNANLIMTHENGKREWVGKQAGSSAIVNDTQMSDIMEMAVAKGVYSALSARGETSGTPTNNETIVVKIGEEAVFNAVRKTAKRQGRDFAMV